MDARILQEPIHHLDPPLADRVNVELPLAEAITQMQEVTSEHHRGIGALLVTQKGKLTGIITERDLVRRVISHKRDIKSLTAGQVMTAQPETLTAEDPIAFALNLMHLGHYRHIPLVNEENEPVGIITSKDIIKYISKFIKSI